MWVEFGLRSNLYKRDIQSNLIFIQTQRGSSLGLGQICINAIFNQTLFSYKLNIGWVFGLRSNLYKRNFQSNLILIQTQRGSSSGLGRVCMNATFNQTLFSYKLNVGRVRAQVECVWTRLSIKPYFHINSI